MANGPEQGQTHKPEIPQEVESSIINRALECIEEGGQENFRKASNMFAYLADPENAPQFDVAEESAAEEITEPLTEIRTSEVSTEDQTPKPFAYTRDRLGKAFESFKNPRRTGLMKAVGAVAAGASLLGIGYAAGHNGGEGPNNPINPEIARADGLSTNGASANHKKEHNSDHKMSANAREIATVKNVRTVPRAVEELHSAGQNELKSNMRKAMQNKFGEKRLDHDNAGGNNQMDSLFTEFDPATVNARDAAEGVAFGIGGSNAYAAANYNALVGNEISENLPAGVSMSEARKVLENQLTSKDTKIFINEHKSGLFMNHGQNGEDVFEAGLVNINDGRVLVIETPSGKKLLYKIEDGHKDNACLNLLTEQKVTITVPSQPEQPASTPATTPTPNPTPTPTPTPTPVPVPPAPVPNPQPKPNPKPKGKDHTESPVSSDPNDPNEVVRPNIPAPKEAIQPVGAPEEDPYTPPETVTPPEGVGPTPDNPSDETPASGEDNKGQVTGP